MAARSAGRAIDQCVGAPPIEALITDPALLKQIYTAQGIEQRFDLVDDALAWLTALQAAAQETGAYWRRAEAFPGRDDD